MINKGMLVTVERYSEYEHFLLDIKTYRIKSIVYDKKVKRFISWTIPTNTKVNVITDVFVIETR